MWLASQDGQFTMLGLCVLDQYMTLFHSQYLLGLNISYVVHFSEHASSDGWIGFFSLYLLVIRDYACH